ncbi:hypothetical protein ACELLULO517_07945 [Acidisoma cellulosilytica]|uniref:Uncharacterized protein n=1 Tax=Acidisoma cellulosilyticum TaxID=2802395 RepID=A0A963YZX4_9PROT|nr:hypothetical protein [Acidisoma cellulosilyticum]MCB8880161.1 hypothetical protein [Acidisoma cellulosilyticum]
MRKRLATFAAVSLLALAGCLHRDLPPDTAVMPAGALGTNGDIDIRALDIAAFDFAHAITGNPGKAATAIAALDYLGGELNSSPRWIDMDSLTRLQMLDWRTKMRAQVGISPTAPAQAVLNTMLALGQAYQANDQAAVQHLLASPIFTIPPDQVADRLGNIPYNASLNAVTTRADSVLDDVNFSG